MRLPSHDRLLQAVPDAMHTVKDVVEGIVHLLIGRDDTKKLHTSEVDRSRFGFNQNSVAAMLDPQCNRDVPYSLSPSMLAVANERVQQNCVPSHLDFSPKYLFSKPSRLKAHDWKQVKYDGTFMSQYIIVYMSTTIF